METISAPEEQVETEENPEGRELSYDDLRILIREALIRNAELAAKLEDEFKKSNTDKLTGVKNRAGFNEIISRRKPESQENVVILFFDTDGFKPINDTLGHAAGDFILQEIVKHLKDSVRSTDEVVRWGGDEFLVVCLGGDEEALTQKFKDGFAFETDYNGQKIPVSLSVGIAQQAPGESIEEVVARADQKMFALKESRGKAR